jgi:nicotinamide mononucleotide adenylyltransferase
MAELKYKMDMFDLFKGSPHLKIYYFIGRLNPPHDGHIEALITMITEANANNSVALILLGSGPFEGERTMDNPIPYESKVDFLRYILPKHLQCEIRQMSTPADDVSLWYQTILSHIKPPLSVEFIRYAGDKDGNLKKSNYMETALLRKFPTAKAHGVAVTAKPVNEKNKKIVYSASAVREFAYTQYLSGLQDGTDGFANFDKEYKKLYGDFTRQMYDEILFPIQNEQLTPAQVRAYIDDHSKEDIYKLPMSDARRALVARKAQEKAARNAAAKADKSLATVAASVGNAVTARNELRETKKSTTKAATKGTAEPSKGKGGKESKKTTIRATPGPIGEGLKRGGGTKKRRHRKTRKKLSNRK